jgi:hypothetical protein
LDDYVKPLVIAVLRREPFKLNKSNCSRQALFGSRMFDVEVNFAELSEPLAVPNGYARRDGLEVSIVRQKDRVKVLSGLRDDGVLRVGRKHVSEANDRMPPCFKQFAGGFRDIVVSEEPQLWDRSQAASLMFWRTVETSNFVRVGYSPTIALSE